MKVNQNWKLKGLEDLLYNTKRSDQYKGDIREGNGRSALKALISQNKDCKRPAKN